MRFQIGVVPAALVEPQSDRSALLAVIVLPWLPIFGPPSDPAPATGPGGRGPRHPDFCVRPRWRDDRDHPDRRARGPAGRGGRRERPRLPGPPRFRPGPGVLARRPVAGRGRLRTRYPPVRPRSRRGGASPGDADPLWQGPGLLPRRPHPGRVELSSITRSSSGTSPRGGSGRGCGATIPRDQPGVRPRWPVPGLGGPER